MIKSIFKQPFLGGFFTGFGLPVGNSCLLSSALMDAVVFIPLGIVLLTISYYLTFNQKS